MMTTKKFQDILAINYLEILVLLMLPMPFLKLNIVYIVLVLCIILISKYLRRESWSSYGFVSVNRRDLTKAFFIGLIFGFADNYYLEPFVTESLFGKVPDLSSLDDVRGNLKRALLLIVIGWLVGGLFEEFLFRGYLFHRICAAIKNERLRNSAVVLITSVVFAFSHLYQDYSGVFSAFYFSFIMGLLYFYFKRNVWYLILVHGIYDTIGIALVYFAK